jgi:hypothetical protein
MTGDGKLYPWIEEEYGPAPARWMWERDPRQVARERIEILRAQVQMEERISNGARP